VIVIQTPLRLSFFGGGTDFREYFVQSGGAVLTTAINRYIFVILKRRFDDKIRVGYSTTEIADHIDEIHHELVRECLRKTGITKGVEIATMGDIPSQGSGLGSSSTVTVGLLNAMYQYLGEPRDIDTLAREACEIEIDILKKPIGVQDQYIAAYGGQRIFRFHKGGSVTAETLRFDEVQLRRLGQNLLLFYTGGTRKAESILAEQRDNIAGRLAVLDGLKALVDEAAGCLAAGCYDDFGVLLDKGWQLKKQMASRISNIGIEDMYAAARRGGALGGKLAGAGGSGFLLLYCKPEKHASVRAELNGAQELSFDLEPFGTKAIFNYARR
jgi:D-glycero-alpha-D-manno-heptose-7-phosphate kinase